MREFGKIITRKTDLTDAQVQEKYKFPAIIILHDNEDQILKITHYQKNGTKTIYDFSQSASKQFVTDSITTAIAGLQDNRLEFNEFSDFPAIGDETKFYIDLTDDRIYIWDSYSQTYKNQSWDTATIASIQASIASAQMAFQNLQNSKQNKLETVSGNTGVGKTDASATEKLDIAGRSKSDGQVFNETTSAILPKEIKFKDGKFKAALADGVEKAILLEGDVSSDDKFVKEVVYNGRQEIYLSSFNYATGRGTTTVPHGLPIGSIMQSSVVPNSFKTLHNDHSKYPSLITDLKAIPYEFYTSMRDIYIVDANTIEIRNSGGAAIVVNTTSTQNNGNMQTSNFSWHIEVKPIGGFINIDGLPTNLKNFRIECLMLGDYADSSGSEYRRLFFKRYDENNISQSIPSLGEFFNNNGAISAGSLGNYNWDRLSFGFSVFHNIYARTLIDVHCNSNLMTVSINEKRYGRGTAAFATTEVKFNNLLDIPMPNNNGISEIALFYGANFRLANGSVFKIYKY